MGIIEQKHSSYFIERIDVLIHRSSSAITKLSMRDSIK